MMDHLCDVPMFHQGAWTLTVCRTDDGACVRGYCQLDAPPRHPRRVWLVSKSGRTDREGYDGAPDALDLAALEALAKAGLRQLLRSAPTRVGADPAPSKKRIPTRAERKRALRQP